MHRLKQVTLLLGDILVLYIGLYAAIFLRYLEAPDTNLLTLLPSFTLLFLLAAIIIFISGLYDVSKAKNSWRFYQRIIISACTWMIFGIIYFYIDPKQSAAPKTILLLTTVIGFGLIALWRHIYNKFIALNLKYNVIFVGITEEVAQLIKHIQKEPQLGYAVAGLFIKNEDNTHTTLINELQQTGIIIDRQIDQIKLQYGRDINIIVLSPDMASDKNLLKDLYQNLFKQISIVGLSDFYESIMNRIPPFSFSEGWFITNLQEQHKKIYDRFRILVDYVLALLIGLVFIVTLPFVALAIKLNSKGNIFFTQNRVGRLGIIFKVYKFRTMQSLTSDGSAEINGPQFAAKNDDRITKVGKFLRLTRLDEIPQFINIFKGEMSFIGPRPERPEFVAQITEQMPFYSLRHLIKPGLTGWAQIHKSYYGTIEENLRKLEYDLFYIKNRNLTLDTSILLRTINTIAKFGGR